MININKFLKILLLSLTSLGSIFISSNKDDQLKVLHAEETTEISREYHYLTAATYLSRKSSSDYEVGYEKENETLYVQHYDYRFDFNCYSDYLGIELLISDLDTQFDNYNKYFSYWKEKKDTDSHQYRYNLLSIDNVSVVDLVFDDSKDEVYLVNYYGDIDFNFTDEYDSIYLDFDILRNSNNEYDSNFCNFYYTDFSLNGLPFNGIKYLGISDSSSIKLNYGELSTLEEDGSFSIKSVYIMDLNFDMQITQANGTNKATTIYNLPFDNWIGEYKQIGQCDFGYERQFTIKDFVVKKKKMNQGVIKFIQSNGPYYVTDDYKNDGFKFEINKLNKDFSYVYNNDLVCQCYIDTTKFNVKATDVNGQIGNRETISYNYSGMAISCDLGAIISNWLDKKNANSRYYYQSFCFDFYFDKDRTQKIDNVETVVFKFQRSGEQVTSDFIQGKRPYIVKKTINELTKKPDGIIDNGFISSNYSGLCTIGDSAFTYNNVKHDYTYLNCIDTEEEIDGQLINYLDPLSVTYKVIRDHEFAIWSAWNNDVGVYIAKDECYYMDGSPAKDDGYLVFTDSDGSQAIALDQDKDGKVSINDVIDGRGEFTNYDNDVVEDPIIDFDSLFDPIINFFSGENSLFKSILKIITFVLCCFIFFYILKFIVFAIRSFSKVFKLTKRKKRKKH